MEQPTAEQQATAKNLRHCAIVVSDWMACGCDALDIPRPHIAVLATWAKESAALACCTKMAVEAERQHADAERVDWLMRNVSGAELRRIGLMHSAGCERADIDRAMRAQAA